MLHMISLFAGFEVVIIADMMIIRSEKECSCPNSFNRCQHNFSLNII